MKKISSLKLGAIQELSKSEQKNIVGAGPNSPCCPTSPYYNVTQCYYYSGGGYPCMAACGTGQPYCR